jgi:hypothetical protein
VGRGTALKYSSSTALQHTDQDPFYETESFLKWLVALRVARDQNIFIKKVKEEFCLKTTLGMLPPH